MMRSLWLVAGFCMSALVLVPGCGAVKQHEWEVAVESKGDTPCSFFITLGVDGKSTANVADVTKGKMLTLIVGARPTVVHTIIVKCGKDEQTLTPKADLAPGQRYVVLMNAEGKVETSIQKR